MAAIIPYLKNHAFDPKEITAMSMALDDICKSLHLAESAIDARQVVAERIIELARQGVRSPTVLRDRVLEESGFGNGQNGYRWSGM